MNPITTSLFELFKLGPGPSSSHTIGPMRAGAHFRQRVLGLPAEERQAARGIEVTLFGSLSATGRGHGTHRAVLAGLMGEEPETVDPEALRQLLKEAEAAYPLQLGEVHLLFTPASLHWGPVEHSYQHSNTLIFSLLGENGPILEAAYYSTGGGFIQWDGCTVETREPPPYPYHNLRTLRAHLKEQDLSLPELILRNEEALTGLARGEIIERLDRLVEAMREEVERGLDGSGLLPGPIELRRKAPALHRRALSDERFPDRALVFLNAFSLAASEENAAGNRVVTAPTSGAAGVIPGLLHWLRIRQSATPELLREGLIAAGAVGFLIKHNASISGAEVGCQGEVGAASAMGAALLAQVNQAPLDVLACAAEIALEHHLGMTCDPVGGFVQIPCIERNAMGAVKAYNSFLMASAGVPAHQKVSLDQVIQTLRETGRDMSTRYKETSLGGLAVNMTEC